MTRTILLLLLTSSVVRADTTVNVEKLSVNGQEIRHLKCVLKNADFFASMIVAAGVAAEKKALDACAPEGAAFRVEWKWKGGKASDVKVTAASAEKAKACVVKALGQTTATDADCSAVILVGELKGAEKAAEKAAGTLKD